MNPRAAPVNVRLTTLEPQPCPYLPGRGETVSALMAASIDGATYHAFLEAGFRRSGKMIYQPVCDGCSECVSIRVPVNTFTPTSSQKRSVRKNDDLRVTFGVPIFTEEKFAMYARYVRQWHKREQDANEESMRQFLYDSPTDTVEFCYRDKSEKLVGVGICDIGPSSLSSVYFYFDPDEASRSPGTFSAMYEIDWARARKLAHYYLGYWIRDCSAMAYKANFAPHELLGADGVWR